MNTRPQIDPALTRVDPEDNCLIEQLPNEIKGKIFSYLSTKEKIKGLYSTSTSLYFFNQEEVAEMKLRKAVLEEDRDLISHLMIENPVRLLATALPNETQQSQFTWQHFNFTGESALSIAVKRKQIDMVYLLLSYANDLYKHEKYRTTIDETLLLWKNYDTASFIEEHSPYFLSLIQVFATETLPKESENMSCQLSEPIEKALVEFRKIMLPNHPARLNDHIEPELLLYTAYKLYYSSDRWQDFQLRSFFCVKVIGFLQSLIAPGTAKIMCQGIHKVINNQEAISPSAEQLKLSGGAYNAYQRGDTYYRQKNKPYYGLGFTQAISMDGDATGPGTAGIWAGSGELGFYYSFIINDFKEVLLNIDEKFKQVLSNHALNIKELGTNTNQHSL